MRRLAALLVALCLCRTAASADSTPKDALGEVVEVKWWQDGRRLSSNTDQQAMPEEMDVEFTTAKTRFHLRLRRNRVLLPADVRHVLHYEDGRTEEGPMPQSCFYLGEVLGDVRGSASISTCDGAFNGLVMGHNQAVVIEPLAGRKLAEGDVLANGEHHRVSVMDDEQFKDFVGDVGQFASTPLKNVSGGRALSPERSLTAAKKYVEVVVVNDKRRYTSFGGQTGLPALAAQSVSVMSTVTAIYNTAPAKSAVLPYKIQVVLVGMHTMLQDDPWEATVKMAGSETDCSSLLGIFNQWGSTQQAAGKLTGADNRVLLSGRDFDGSTVGLAGVSAMCLASRSGSVNMCQKSSNAAGCAAVVAHEMGHNFGMHHDGSGDNSGCSQSGLIMESVGDQNPSTQFSDCSVKDIKSFFDNSYTKNGNCLENLPTTVFGDPVCQNGFVEAGEDCDCGSSDCTSADPCCNGATCKFKESSYQCSDAMGPCCSSCKFVSASANKVCRPALSSCDLPETCAGGVASCAKDIYVYPGKACSISGGGKTYSGLCASGQCMSLDYTCAVDITRDFDLAWDLTPTCAAFNDNCGSIVCHKASSNLAYSCGQNFATHGKQMSVPDGTPCWFPADPVGSRSGMCSSGQCKQEFSLAIVPFCGNGGIDFGEQCDCGNGGSAGDSCCDCATCKLKATSKCSALDACCDSSTCKPKAANTVCRAAVSSCDEAEVCTGTSAICPSDAGKKWGTACTENGVGSTCYGKKCMTNMDTQCNAVSATALPRSRLNTAGSRITGVSHECDMIMCCQSCEQKSGNWNVNGESVTDPWLCSGCGASSSSTTFTVNGVSNTIHLKAALDGTVLSDSSKVCIAGAATTPAAQCSSGQFLEISVGKCLTCSTACTSCTGPTNFDCTGACKYGGKDCRGACAISADQLSFATQDLTCTPATTVVTTTVITTVGPTTTAGPTTTVTSTTSTTLTTTVTTTTAVVTKLTGSLDMTVPDPQAFKDDTAVQTAVLNALAEVFGVPASYIALIVTVSGNRRLGLSNDRAMGRRLAGKVKVAYTVTMAPTASVTPAVAKNNLASKSLAQITTAVQAKVVAAKGNSYTVTVDAKTAVATEVSQLTTTKTTTVTTTAKSGGTTGGTTGGTASGTTGATTAGATSGTTGATASGTTTAPKGIAGAASTSQLGMVLAPATIFFVAAISQL